MSPPNAITDGVASGKHIIAPMSFLLSTLLSAAIRLTGIQGTPARNNDRV
jgi:hypothetical protein